MTAAVLTWAVDAVVTADLQALSVAELQAGYLAVTPQVERLRGFSGAVQAELHARTGGQLPTEDGRTRPLPGWAAEASGDSANAAGRMIRTAELLKQGLPAVERSVLDGTLPFVRAEVLARLVGRIDAVALAEAEPALIEAAEGMDPQQLAA
jgi:hypothetical protein